MTAASTLTPDNELLAIGEELTPLPSYKIASTTTISFDNLLDPPLKLHEDLSAGCGGQLWPAGMVLAKHLLHYHREAMATARILELGAGGGLVGLAVALACSPQEAIFITDQSPMLKLMRQNIALNFLESRVNEFLLDWGSPLPKEIVEFRPNVILAADCVYFEPAFPLLLATLEALVKLCEETVIYFCFKRRRRADMQFLRQAKKKFQVDEIEDEDREIFSRERLFLYTFRRKM
ncbi:BgTH12-00638 [Blumeria graminis f. sp. triticale]|uniref:Protein-lysine N-methyltransferase EFM6 n=3 Tax=Blumeria graminis TaxID=34373 RepID=A0A061HN32_BLUGR|nr:hypothetical protein BGT96224_1308 [Blumeria graminis f. sp. tritici 96224]CAD6505143.1 BgTH12-00638 [Blumeria graminis f. sp. triticale]VDB93144.1 Bgt-1308 [Blumeria graminis f. sp. tritici]